PGRSVRPPAGCGGTCQPPTRRRGGGVGLGRRGGAWLSLGACAFNRFDRTCGEYDSPKRPHSEFLFLRKPSRLACINFILRDSAIRDYSDRFLGHLSTTGGAPRRPY